MKAHNYSGTNCVLVVVVPGNFLIYHHFLRNNNCQSINHKYNCLKKINLDFGAFGLSQLTSFNSNSNGLLLFHNRYVRICTKPICLFCRPAPNTVSYIYIVDRGGLCRGVPHPPGVSGAGTRSFKSRFFPSPGWL
jgi:hypothetical protein